MTKCVDTISSLLHLSNVRLRDLQHLIGLLNFTCGVVLPGRAFLRRLIDLTIGRSHANSNINLTSGCKEDLRVWLAFLRSFNGLWFLLQDRWVSSPTLHMWTDASKSLGFGTVLGHRWFYDEFPESWKTENIVTLELYPIVLACELFAQDLRHKCILFHTDNEALVTIINKQTCKDPITMRLVRRLVLVALKNNILFRSVHILGSKNQLADCLSCLQIGHFKTLAPWANRYPEVIPATPLIPGELPLAEQFLL